MKVELQCRLQGQKPGFWCGTSGVWSTEFEIDNKWKLIDGELFVNVLYHQYEFKRELVKKKFWFIPYTIEKESWIKLRTLKWISENNFRVVTTFVCGEENAGCGLNEE